MKSSKKETSKKEETKKEEFFTDEMHKNIFVFQESELSTERTCRRYLKTGANIKTSKPSYNFS